VSNVTSDTTIKLRHTRFEIERALLKDEELSSNARLVLLVLLMHANGTTGILEERYTPSQDDMARMTKLNVRTVRKALAELEAAGWLETERPTIEQRARRKKILYTFLMPHAASAAEGEEQGPAETPDGPTGGAPHAPDKVAQYTRTGSPSTPLNNKNNRKNNPPTPQTLPADAPARLHPQLEHEHIGRWTRARWRKQVNQALAEGWRPEDLTRELAANIGNARSVAAVVDYRLKNLGAPPKPTPVPPAYRAEPVPMVHAEAVRTHQKAARDALAAVRAALVPAPTPTC